MWKTHIGKLSRQYIPYNGMAFAMPFFMDRKTARSSESCNMLSDDLFCLPKSEPV
ncbi:hypothetical protein MCC93_27070 [Morococcus cerebrosus]|uniref:Uncharacterized protein n=1 Tax=Morococcus cerebrosus TaxID=1056807 RepID=A0A0C1GK88_9NEIS|nr:hypothetical protein MCC93_27070 [Morococcus cerebrosus]